MNKDYPEWYYSKSGKKAAIILLLLDDKEYIGIYRKTNWKKFFVERFFSDEILSPSILWDELIYGESLNYFHEIVVLYSGHEFEQYDEIYDYFRDYHRWWKVLGSTAENSVSYSSVLDLYYEICSHEPAFDSIENLIDFLHALEGQEINELLEYILDNTIATKTDPENIIIRQMGPSVIQHLHDYREWFFDYLGWCIQMYPDFAKKILLFELTEKTRLDCFDEIIIKNINDLDFLKSVLYHDNYQEYSFRTELIFCQILVLQQNLDQVIRFSKDHFKIFEEIEGSEELIICSIIYKYKSHKSNEFIKIFDLMKLYNFYNILKCLSDSMSDENKILSLRYIFNSSTKFTSQEEEQMAKIIRSIWKKISKAELRLLLPQNYQKYIRK